MSSETNELKEMLDKIYTTQVLILANQIKQEKAAHGSQSTDGYVQEAINQIRARTPEIIQRIARSLQV